MKVNLCFRVDEKDKELLERIASKRGKDVSDLLREALAIVITSDEEYLEKIKKAKELIDVMVK